MSARLIAEIGADTSGFEAGLRRADAISGKFGKQIAGKLNAAFGIGFAATFLAQIPRKLIDQSEAIDKGAKRIHATAEEYQMLTDAGRDLGMSAEELVKHWSDQGVMLADLLPKLQKYKSALHLSNEDVETFVSAGQVVAKAGALAMRPAVKTVRAGKSAWEFLKNEASAAWNAIKNPSSIPDSAGNVIAGLLGFNDVGPEPLRLPTGLKDRAKMKLLQENLRSLGFQEDSLKEEARTRTSLWNPDLTDRQQGGAYVSRGGLVISENRETNQRLEEIRAETAKVKEEIAKLREGG